MFSSTTSLLICIAAIWLTQRLLTINQVIQFRKQLLAIRSEGQMSVGVAKKFGRRVFVGLAFSPLGEVRSALVLRGVTVFSRGRQQPALIGCRAVDLATGRVPPGLSTLVIKAAQQSAQFLIDGVRTSQSPIAAVA